MACVWYCRVDGVHGSEWGVYTEVFEVLEVLAVLRVVVDVGASLEAIFSSFFTFKSKREKGKID